MKMDAIKTITGKTVIAVGICAFAAWGSRVIKWHPQAALPGLISPWVFSVFELIALKFQERFSNDNSPHISQAPRHKELQFESFRLRSELIGALAAAILLPQIIKRLGYSMSLRASIAYTLPSLFCSYVVPPRRVRGY